jgi:glycine dehydrogenase subunit 1
VAPLVEKLAKDGILAGVPLARFEPARDRDLLIAVTERHSKADLDRLIAALT